MRPSQKAKEERKWVVDTINKYFDVIVEEEEEEEEEEDVEVLSSSDDDEISSFGDTECSDSEEQYEETESETEENVKNNEGSTFKSTAKMRGLLSTAMERISTSKGDLHSTSVQTNQRQGLLNNLKQKLGSQISLKRQSQDNLTLI